MLLIIKPTKPRFKSRQSRITKPSGNNASNALTTVSLCSASVKNKSICVTESSIFKYFWAVTSGIKTYPESYSYIPTKNEETTGYAIIRGIVPNGVAVPEFAEIKETLSPADTRKLRDNEEPIINSPSFILSKIY